MLQKVKVGEAVGRTREECSQLATDRQYSSRDTKGGMESGIGTDNVGNCDKAKSFSIELGRLRSKAK